jgi:hypothetical protein
MFAASSASSYLRRHFFFFFSEQAQDVCTEPIFEAAGVRFRASIIYVPVCNPCSVSRRGAIQFVQHGRGHRR